MRKKVRKDSDVTSPGSGSRTDHDHDSVRIPPPCLAGLVCMLEEHQERIGKNREYIVIITVASSSEASLCESLCE